MADYLNIFAGGNSPNTGSDTNTPSRLSESSKGLRDSLKSRNLYTEFSQYPLQENDRQKIVNSVSSVIDRVLPFKSFNLSNSAIGRLVSSPTTPLSEIGLIMLGKQFALNFQSNALQKVSEIIQPRNLFDGDKNTKLFQFGKDFSITSKGGKFTFDDFVEDFFGYHPKRDNVFDNNPTNADYLKNTGNGQLNLLFGDGTDLNGGLNRNLYKPDDDAYSEVGTLYNRKKLIGDGTNEGGKIFFNPENKKFNPYDDYFISIDNSAIIDANKAMRNAYYITSVGQQEYAPDNSFIDDNLGKTKNNENKIFFQSTDPTLENQWINAESGLQENINEQIIWGRDGVAGRANNRLDSLRGMDSVEDFEGISPNNNLNGNFGVRTGLLEYTRNLLNATEGKIIDQTRKVFTKGDNLQGFNGSGLWKAPNNSLFPNKVGVRQHSPLDQYDKFAKAIRFDGNEVYGGNENSVTYKSVLPRIHPTINKENGLVDNRNLMFSIENLAVNVIGRDNNYGIIDDQYGTQIPLSEVGQFGGRVMWYPPYDISINEVATANYDKNVMVGRSEPIYTYMHSERSANVSFKMIVDYPEQVRNAKNYKEVAEFFAFGGEEFKYNPPKEKPVDDISEPKPTIPKVDLPEDVGVYFPNDVPLIGNTTYSVIDNLYSVDRYEILDNFPNKVDTKSYGLNEDIYVVTGVTLSSGTFITNDFLIANFVQSQATFIQGIRELDDNIYTVFKDERNRLYYKINVVGTATLLYTPTNSADIQKGEQYNIALSERRAKVAKSFIQERIKKIFGQSAESLGIEISTESKGAVGNNDTVASIPEKDAKEERSAFIQFVSNGKSTDEEYIDSRNNQLSPEEKKAKEEEDSKRAEEVAKQRYYERNIVGENVMNERDKDSDAILKGGKAITENYFYPAFHSQTPEDFHKRLTFLQQCTRQGSSIRTNPEVDENGIERARNSAFGRQPVCILRIADFFYTKVIIENVTIDYSEAPWDTNPEGWGMQPMMAEVTMQMKVIGGQSLKGPIDALQNAVSFNYYANSTFKNVGVYRTATQESDNQSAYNNDIQNAKQKKNQENLRELKTKLAADGRKNIYGYEKPSED